MGHFETAWYLMKEESQGKEALIRCLKKKGGAASLEDCCKATEMSIKECKSLIASMDNIKISPHGDVILMDGL